MKRAFAALLLTLPVTLSVSGCLYGESMEKIHAGMTREEVVATLGQPEGTSNTAGRECARYTVTKDFMSRVPWNMSDPYYVCYTDGKVETFGRASVANPG
jgi:SmpA / OmlA family